MASASKTDLLDKKESQENQVTKKPIISLWFLIVGASIIGVTFLTATFWTNLGFSKEDTFILALSLMFAFGINLAGFVIGFTELKKNKTKAVISILGNVLLIFLFIFIVVYSIRALQSGQV